MSEPDIFYLVQLRASAIEQMEKDGYTWIAPEHVIRLLDAVEAIRARVAELEADKEKQREMFFKALKERPVAPHPVDQMANLHREMLKDAEAECKVFMASNAALTDEVLALRARVAVVERENEELRRVNEDLRARVAELEASVAGMLEANIGMAGERLALRARVVECEAALMGIADVQWPWHGGVGYTRQQHAEHVEQLQQMARAALGMGEQSAQESGK